MASRKYCFNGVPPKDFQASALQVGVIQRDIDPNITRGLANLTAAFAAADLLFNNNTITPAAFAALGYFKDGTFLNTHGPTTALFGIGAGSSAAIGVTEASTLQSTIAAAIKAGAGVGSTSTHDPLDVVVVTSGCDGAHCQVNSKITIRDANSAIVAVVRGTGMFHFPGTDDVPTMDWFTATLAAN